LIRLRRAERAREIPFGPDRALGGRPLPTSPHAPIEPPRAYQLVGGGAALAAVVAFLLALFTGFSWAIVLLAALIAVVCFLMFKRIPPALPRRSPRTLREAR